MNSEYASQDYCRPIGIGSGAHHSKVRMAEMLHSVRVPRVQTFTVQWHCETISIRYTHLAGIVSGQTSLRDLYKSLIYIESKVDRCRTETGPRAGESPNARRHLGIVHRNTPIFGYRSYIHCHSAPHREYALKLGRLRQFRRW